MTALQSILKEAKALKKSYPNRYDKWTDYVKQASAIYAGKHKGKSPVGKKRVVKKSAPKKKIGAVGSDSQLASELEQYCDYSSGDFLQQFIVGAQDLGYTEKQASRAIKLIIQTIKLQLEDSIDYVYN